MILTTTLHVLLVIVLIITATTTVVESFTLLPLYFQSKQQQQPTTPYYYQKGDSVPLFVNSLRSAQTLLPLNFYHFPFCRPNAIQSSVESLGQIITGDAIFSSSYTLTFLQNVSCARRVLPCAEDFAARSEESIEDGAVNDHNSDFVRAHIDLIEKLIEEEYYGELMIRENNNNHHAYHTSDNNGSDLLPGLNPFFDFENKKKKKNSCNTISRRGFPLGVSKKCSSSSSQDSDSALLNNHLEFIIKYHRMKSDDDKISHDQEHFVSDSSSSSSSANYSIVEFSIIPKSINFGNKNNANEISVCRKNSAENDNDDGDDSLLPTEPLKISDIRSGEATHIYFTYSVKWIEVLSKSSSSSSFSTRNDDDPWSPYLLSSSLIAGTTTSSSFLSVLVGKVLLLFLIVYFTSKDIVIILFSQNNKSNNHNEEEEEEVVDDEEKVHIVSSSSPSTVVRTELKDEESTRKRIILARILRNIFRRPSSSHQPEQKQREEEEDSTKDFFPFIVSNGVQLLFSLSILLLCGCLGFYSPSNPGSIVTVFIMSLVVTSFFAGYVCSSMTRHTTMFSESSSSSKDKHIISQSRQKNSSSLVKTKSIIFSLLGFPGLLFLVWGLISIFFALTATSGSTPLAVPNTTLGRVAGIFFFILAPLYVLGFLHSSRQCSSANDDDDACARGGGKENCSCCGCDCDCWLHDIPLKASSSSSSKSPPKNLLHSTIKTLSSSSPKIIAFTIFGSFLSLSTILPHFELMLRCILRTSEFFDLFGLLTIEVVFGWIVCCAVTSIWVVYHHQQTTTTKCTSKNLFFLPWWWLAFLAPSCGGISILLYLIYVFTFSTHTLQVSTTTSGFFIFWTYGLLFTIAYVLMSGIVGFLGTLIFLNKIYTRNKEMFTLLFKEEEEEDDENERCEDIVGNTSEEELQPQAGSNNNDDDEVENKISTATAIDIIKRQSTTSSS